MIVGDWVWWNAPNKDVFPAIVVRVHDDGRLNLVVFKDQGDAAAVKVRVPEGEGMNAWRRM